MTTDSTTTVRPKSLAGFEDDPEDTIPVPPRRRRAAPTAPTAVKDAEPAESAAPSDESTQAVTADDPADVPTRPAEKTAARGSRPTSAEVPAGTKPKVRPSNVHIPPDLADKFEAKCREKNMFHGDLIIVALETVGEDLPKLLRHKEEETVGGSIFEARPSRPAKDEVRKTQVNFSMLQKDFDALDAAVKLFNARSRNHLIVAALRGYLAD